LPRPLVAALLNPEPQTLPPRNATEGVPYSALYPEP